LPAQLFRSVNVAVTIWVLRGPAHARDQVLFIDATRMGRMRSRAQRALSDVEIEKIVRQYRNWITNGRREVSRGIEGLARSVEIDRLAAHDYVLNPALYLDQLVQEPDEDRVLANVANLRRQLSALRGQVARGIFEDPLIDLDPAALQRAQPSAQQTWSRMHLADICDIMAGPGAVDRGSMQDAWIPIVLPRNIRSHQIVDENYDAVHPDVAMKLSRYRLREGDVITTRIGALGRNGVISSEQAGWLLGPGCIRLRPRDDVDGRFLAYYLSSPTARDWMERNAGGAAIKNISTKTLGRMPVALPPIDQQLTIGAVLSALDSDLITVQQIVSLTERLRDDLATLLLMGMPVRPRQY